MTFDGATKDPMKKAVRDYADSVHVRTDPSSGGSDKGRRAGRYRARAKQAHDERACLGRKSSYTREQFAKVRDMLGQTAVGPLPPLPMRSD